MKNMILTVIVLSTFTLTGCGYVIERENEEYYDSLSRLGTQGPKFGPIADNALKSTLSIEGCPEGYYARRPVIQVFSDQDVRDQTGRVTWESNAGGSRSHKCMPDPNYGRVPDGPGYSQ
jgi:hypothetical protein